MPVMLEKELLCVIEWSKQKEINDKIIHDVDTRVLNALVDLEVFYIRSRQKRKISNEKTREYIKAKRKVNPDYARPQREHRKKKGE